LVLAFGRVKICVANCICVHCFAFFYNFMEMFKTSTLALINIYCPMKGIKLLFILFALHIGELRAQQDSTALISALNAQIIKVDTFLPEANFDDLKFLDAILEDRKIIALGEGTHGTREHFLYKDRLIRYLISRLISSIS